MFVGTAERRTVWGEEFCYYAAINTEIAYPLQCVATCGESHGFSLFCVAECVKRQLLIVTDCAIKRHGFKREFIMHISLKTVASLQMHT